MAASRTKSSESARPPKIGEIILGRCGWNLVPNVVGRNTKRVMNPSLTVLRGDCALAMMSGRRPSRRSIPNPARTSLRPCAAPCLSTPDVSALRVRRRPGTRSGKWTSPNRSTSVPRALAAVARASGTGSTRTRCIRGSSRERYGTKSFDSVSEARLPTIWEALRLVSAPRSRKPRSRMGTTWKWLSASISDGILNRVPKPATKDRYNA